jgi:hypothetical protein
MLVYCTFKVAVTNVMLWFCIWTPYAVVNMIAQYGDVNLVTPLTSQLPAFFGRARNFVPCLYCCLWMRSRRVVRASSDCQCRSRNSPSILRHSGTEGRKMKQC